MRKSIGWVLLFVGFSLFFACNSEQQSAAQQSASITKKIIVYKSPTCTCCTAWEEHMRNAGFEVESIAQRNITQVKVDNGIPLELQSCHTAFVGDYIIEGHVPAKDVIRLLEEKPDIKGLTAPGMPQNSPGMQPEGLRPQGYDVLAFDELGNTSVFSAY